jgi:hypothetical protein
VEVLLDGQPIGRTPIPYPFEHGTRGELTLQGQGLKTARREFVAESDAPIHLVLERAKVTVEVNTRPEKATVMQNGKVLGTTPLEFTWDAEVPVELVLTLKDYHPKSVKLVPREGEKPLFELVRQSVRVDSPFKTKGQR